MVSLNNLASAYHDMMDSLDSNAIVIWERQLCMESVPERSFCGKTHVNLRQTGEAPVPGIEITLCQIGLNPLYLTP
jgi:hypothetical protein